MGDKAWNKVEQRKGRSNILFSLLSLFLYLPLPVSSISSLSLSHTAAFVLSLSITLSACLVRTFQM